MEKVRPWCGQPLDRRRLKNRTEQNLHIPDKHTDRSLSARPAEIGGISGPARPVGQNRAAELSGPCRPQVQNRPVQLSATYKLQYWKH